MTTSTSFPATREAALKALERFLPAAGRSYARERNFDYGPDDRRNVSVLSPYVRHRLLLEEEVLTAVLEQHGLSESQKFVDEVFWRAYFKGWLEHHPDVWSNYQRGVATTVRELDADGDACERYNQAISGNTGIDCFDAWARELAATGYLHNHARMWFASIWVFTLDLPWQLGADFFLRHLLDGDPASNTLGWRWVCGLHTRGKTYLARVSNIANFTNYRFNPRGRLATAAPPLTDDELVRSESPAAANAEPDGEFGLIITEDDLIPEQGLLERSPSAVIGFAATVDRSLLPVSPLVYDFTQQAVADALERAEATWGCPAVGGTDDAWGEQLLVWAREQGVDTLVTPWAPVGPAADRLNKAEQTLAGAGVRILRLRRRYDESTWPYTGKGYFKLKRQLPSIIEALELDRSFRQAG